MKTSTKKVTSKKTVTGSRAAVVAKRTKAGLKAKPAAKSKTITKPKARKGGEAKTKKRTVIALDLKRRSSVKKGVEARPAQRHKHEQHVTVDRKINSFYALVFIAVLSSVIGALVFLSSKQEEKIADLTISGTDSANSAAVINQQQNKKKGQDDRDRNSEQTACRKRKFEGEAKIHGWYVKPQDGSDAIVVQVANDDLGKLPLNGDVPAAKKQDFMLAVVDAPATLVRDLKEASSEKPQEFTIKGYVFQCDQTHVASIAPGSQVFKQS